MGERRNDGRKGERRQVGGGRARGGGERMEGREKEGARGVGEEGTEGEQREGTMRYQHASTTLHQGAQQILCWQDYLHTCTPSTVYLHLLWLFLLIQQIQVVLGFLVLPLWTTLLELMWCHRWMRCLQKMWGSPEME